MRSQSFLPNIGRLGHNADFITAASTSKRQQGVAMVCLHDTNSKALLAQIIQSINWMPLYQMGTCEMMVCFYDTIISLVDYHLPLRNIKRHSTDKPWITDQLRRLTHCGQKASKNGQTVKMYRNKVQLRRKFYDREIHNLRNSDQHEWRRSIKQITGLSRPSTKPLQSLASQLHDSDKHELASSIKLRQQVATDLQLLADDIALPLPNAIPDDFVIDLTTVEVKMSHININKAPGANVLTKINAITSL